MEVNLPVPELNVLCDFIEKNIELETEYPQTLKSALVFLSKVRSKHKKW